MSELLYKTSGTLSGASGTAFTGTNVKGDMTLGGANAVRPGTLAAHVDVTAATASLAVYLKWEVSLDSTNWAQVVNGPQAAASVALVTGTSAKVTRSVEAPGAVYGYKYVRASLYSGGATGTAGDLVTLGYVWSKPITAY